ncbi:hypothetical protein SCHPADRAFT_681256 [Schizopora paradoxa]|uniref:DUF6533 domain-containing protein n=1 Tax=Schizopora paradoxa TaxID=27342 RepID=A0A0H2R4E1_9AGAM|nr:hypothetical protein SCHPADRAFT_681256 [Schizopora paradoxa]
MIHLTPEVRALIARDMFQFRFHQFASVASASLICYEYLINFDDELRYLWSRRFKFGSALLLACRYLPFTALLQLYMFVITKDFGIPHCLATVRATSCFIYLQFMLTVLVLLTRAYAVWGGAHFIFIPLLIPVVGFIVGSIYALILFVKGLHALPFHIASGCMIDAKNNDVWIDLAILLVFESFALGLLLAKTLAHRKIYKQLKQNKPQRNILSVMASDGIWYFLCSAVITIANIFVLAGFTHNLQTLFLGMQGVLQNIMCSRLLFNTMAENEAPASTSNGVPRFDARVEPLSEAKNKSKSRRWSSVLIRSPLSPASGRSFPSDPFQFAQFGYAEPQSFYRTHSC